MFVEPDDLNRELLSRTLQQAWGLSVRSLRYEPVGFGTHHYIAHEREGTSWFVNVDGLVAKAWLSEDPELAFDALGRALRTACVLRHGGLAFVHAPIETSTGDVVVRLDDAYAVSVFALIDGTSNEGGVFASDDERRRVLKALGTMHASSNSVPEGLPYRDTLEIPLRERFLEALNEVSTPWTSGPYAEPAREILAEGSGAVRRMFERYDELAEAVAAHSDTWVVTHGEPHGSNVMRTADGELLLIDWDTAAIGPRERDLWHVAPEGDEDWAAYSSTSGVSEPNPQAMELYPLWWALSEITGYTDTFRSTHADDANTRVAWLNFQSYVP